MTKPVNLYVDPAVATRILQHLKPNRGLSDTLTWLCNQVPDEPWAIDQQTMANHVLHGTYALDYDLVADGAVNSSDQGLAAYLGVPPMPAVTPPGTYTVEDLIADTTGLNDGTMCIDFGGGPGDWTKQGHGLHGNAPTGDQITGWGTAQWLACGATVAGARLQVRNLKFLGLTSGHVWESYGGSYGDWVQTFDPNTTSGEGNAVGTAGDWEMPAGERALHWSTNRQQTVDAQHSRPLGIVVVYEARGDGIMANAGSDDISGGSILGDMFISKYKKLDAVNWTHVGGSSVTAALLRQFPPPL